MNIDFEKKYHQTETSHFWFKSRRSYIVELLSKKSKNLNVLDIGCSSGILLLELKNIGYNIKNLYGIDISEKAIINCKENGIENAYVMDAQSINLDKKFDIIIASDCLEHILDDEKALKNWHTLLKPNGTLYVFVPAFMMLWSNHDLVNMHFKRYKRNELKVKLIKSGFEIEKASYWNFFLFLPVAIIRVFKRYVISSKQNKTGDLNTISIGNTILFYVINFENKLLKYINFPFGVSAFCIAKK